jgi:predicted DNA-binding transcriptional regulator YafY
MAAGKETLYAQFSLLNYLRGSRDARTVKEILSHLHNNTNWGREQLVNGPSDQGIRNVQNWLRDLRESSEFGKQIEWEQDPENRKQFRYKSRLPAAGKAEMPIEEACTVLMAEKLLDVLLPADFYDASLQDLFRTAREVLRKYDARPKHARRQVKAYLDRVVIADRGQGLVRDRVPYDVLGVISKAMLDGKCVSARYQRDERLLHPYGLVIRGPKIYLLAVDDHAERAVPPSELRPYQFLCVRLHDAYVSDRNNRVPENFDAAHFVAAGGMDVATGEESLPKRAFTLKLRVMDGTRDNLLQDLEEYPLSREQTIHKERGTDSHVLTAAGMRASHQLIEWIVGRLDRVEVLEPKSLRNHVGERIAAIHTLYQSGIA